MTKRSILVSLLFVLASSLTPVAQAEQGNDVKASQNDSSQTGIAYLNRLRDTAGLTELTSDQQLELAAKNHALYLRQHRQRGHVEYSGLSGFSGSLAHDRANAVGYLSKNVTENVSTHSPGSSFYTSIDGLMSAIYHRYAFLSPEIDLIGAAVAPSNKADNQDAYVFNMGNRATNELCKGESFESPGSYFLDVCIDADFKIEKQHFLAASSGVTRENPAIITWPADNSTDTPPAFFEESPDPLPGYGVSGYPVSLEFNAAKFTAPPKVLSFTLSKVEDGSDIPAIIVMNQQNDPNQKHSAYQHTFFPQHRLEWATEYKATVDYYDGSDKTLSWRYTTRDPKIDVVTVDSYHQRIGPLESGEAFYIYLKPQHQNDFSSSYSSRHNLQSLEIEFVDGNTLKVEAQGRGFAEIDVQGRKLRLEVN